MNSFYKFNTIDLLLTIRKLNKTELSCQTEWKKSVDKKITEIMERHNIRLEQGERKRRVFYKQKLNTLKEVRSNGDKYVKLKESKLLIPHPEFDANKELVAEYLYLLDYFKMYFKEEESFKELYKEFMMYSNFLNSIYNFI